MTLESIKSLFSLYGLENQCTDVACTDDPCTDVARNVPTTHARTHARTHADSENNLKKSSNFSKKIEFFLRGIMRPSDSCVLFAKNVFFVNLYIFKYILLYKYTYIYTYLLNLSKFCKFADISNTFCKNLNFVPQFIIKLIKIYACAGTLLCRHRHNIKLSRCTLVWVIWGKLNYMYISKIVGEADFAAS